MFSFIFLNVFCVWHNFGKDIGVSKLTWCAHLPIIYYVKVLIMPFWYFHSTHTNNIIVNRFIKVGIIFFSPINILTIINTTNYMYKNSIDFIIFKWSKIIMHHDNFSYREVYLLWLKEFDMMPMWRQASMTCPLWQSVWCVSHDIHSHDIHTKTVTNHKIITKSDMFDMTSMWRQMSTVSALAKCDMFDVMPPWRQTQNQQTTLAW